MVKEKLKLFYELLFSAMAIVSVIIAVLDLAGKISLQGSLPLQIIDTTILIIFAVDYFARLMLAHSKKKFFLENIPDFIAIIPFSAFFKVFRTAKLFRLVKIARFAKLGRFARIFALLFRFKKTAKRFLRSNGLIYMLLITGALIVLGALGIYAFEFGTTVKSFGDAIWWSFVTTTTVGYGDISPATGMGRVIAGVLMLCGIGTIGLLTGTVATFFINGEASPNQQNTNQVIDLSDMTLEKYNEVIDFVDFLRKRQ